MTKTATKRKVDMPAGIRTKLTAATVMLLIAAILMVSTTYAWFTLSTAPEVTGITTNVGANGNLEMLLLNKDSFKSTEDDLGVVSEVGDSNAVKALTEANLKWGNLVDLSDASYGLDNIVLMPSRLNLATASTLDSTVLLAPSYGTDGRVIDVNTATYSGAREGNSWVYKSFADYAGVRALGTSSGVTQRLSAYRTAKSAVTTNISAAKSAAQQSLTSNGQNLANIVMRHAMANADEAYTLDEIRSLQNMINALQTANDKAGAAIVQAVLANSLSAAQGTELTDAQVLQAVENTGTQVQTAGKDKNRRTHNKSGIVVKGIDDVAVRFAKCCSPVPGDEIVGFVTRGRGVTIHRTDCVNMIHLPGEDRVRLIDAEWQAAGDMSGRYPAEIKIFGNNRTGLLVDISKIFTERQIDMIGVNSRTSKQGTATISLSFEVGSRGELDSLIAKLRQVESVIDIERTTG